jgi:hypothetical protein
MNERIIYPNDEGGVSIVIPTGELSVETVLTKDCPEGAIIIDADSLPADRTFRDAWELVDGKVVVNETKKQAIIDAQTAATTVKESALTKLAALGLTQDEVKALVG